MLCNAQRSGNVLFPLCLLPRLTYDALAGAWLGTGNMVGAAGAGNPAVVAMSCGFYMVCSAGMMIINKMVLRSLPLPMTVVTIQMATTVIALVTSYADTCVPGPPYCTYGLGVPAS